MVICPFPHLVLLQQLMAEERGLTVDVEGFNIAMEEAREKARSARNKVEFFCCFYIWFIRNSHILYALYLPMIIIVPNMYKESAQAYM